MSTGALTKGVGFAHAKAFAQERWGEDGWKAILEKLRPTDREEIGAALPMGWYPLALYARLIQAIDEVQGAGDMALNVQLGRFEAERDLTTIYRIMFRLVNPATVVEKTTDYWRKFHDTGTWEMTRVGSHEIQGVLHGWGVIDHRLCRELVGYFSRLLELVGAEGVIVEHPECRARGFARCFFRARWGKTTTNNVDAKK